MWCRSEVDEKSVVNPSEFMHYVVEGAFSFPEVRAGHQEGVLMRRMPLLLTIVVLVAILATGCSSSDSAGEVPDDVAALIDDWGNAVDSDDGSVTALYRTGVGYHLYNTEVIPYDDLASHLEGGTVPGEWLTDPLLLIDKDDNRYVVARGARANGQHDGSLTFLISRSSDDELEIVKSAWFYAGL